MSRSTRSLLLVAVAALVALPAMDLAAGEVNVYSARKEDLIKPLLDRFTAETGIAVNLVTGKEDALLTRLQSEGASSPADLLVTTDAGRLYRAKEAGVTQAVLSSTLDAAIPGSWRDPEGHWFGLSLRARPILYVKGKVATPLPCPLTRRWPTPGGRASCACVAPTVSTTSPWSHP